MSDGTPQAPSPEHLAELLPQYAIDSLIAKGGMGAVYRGRQVSLDREVAIKVLLNEFGEDAKFLESFATEARAMALLSHSNLLGVFDFGDVEGMPYIVMEYGEGGTLHDAAWNKAIDDVQAADIVKGICAGLAHAHEHGIVHRDIKPANILLTQKAVPKIGDFGLAHASGSDQTGLVMGTPGYTAPEVFRDPEQAGELADIYSVGVILHQLLTGIDPAGSMHPPTETTGNLHLDAIWRKAAHVTPSQRYSSVEEMGEALEKWSSAKQQKLVTGGNAPFQLNKQAPQPSIRPVPVKTGGMGGKIALIGTLVAAIVIVSLIAHHKGNQQNESVADVNGKKNLDTPVPIIETPSPDPIQTDKVTPPRPKPKVVANEPIDKPIIRSPKPKIDVTAPSLPADPKTLADESSNKPIILSPRPEPKIVANEPIVEPVLPKIEGSSPESKPESPVKLLPGDPELRQRAIDFIHTARKKRDGGFAKNARTLLSQLSSHARNAKKDEVEFLEDLKKDVVDNRIPLTDDVTGLPDKLVKSFERARSQEAEIDEAYLARLTVIRDAYVPRLKKAAIETSDAQLKTRLIAQADRAKDLDAWIALLTPEPQWIPKKSSGSFGVGDFVGNWDHFAYNSVGRHIAHPDGRIEIPGRKWKVTWEILENGSLEIVWQDRVKVFTYTRDGDGWTGTNRKGVKASLTRGDW